MLLEPGSQHRSRDAAARHILSPQDNDVVPPHFESPQIVRGPSHVRGCVPLGDNARDPVTTCRCKLADAMPRRGGLPHLCCTTLPASAEQPVSTPVRRVA